MKTKRTQFTAKDLELRGDDSVPIVYSNFAKVQAQTDDMTITFAHITGVPGIHGFDIPEDEGSVQLRPSMVLTLPLGVSAGLAMALLTQLHRRDFSIDQSFAGTGISVRFEEQPTSD